MDDMIVVGIVVMIFVAIIVWDIFLYVDDIEGNSITQIIIKYSKRNGTLPWGIGFFMGWLVGHWWG